MSTTLRTMMQVSEIDVDSGTDLVYPACFSCKSWIGLLICKVRVRPTEFKLALVIPCRYHLMSLWIIPSNSFLSLQQPYKVCWAEKIISLLFLGEIKMYALLCYKLLMGR